jgi:hypothetical protein
LLKDNKVEIEMQPQDYDLYEVERLKERVNFLEAEN